ncbi:MAG: flavodoxin family protein [Eubacterium sp.]|nr:flavodoxin family protein [Eubacterium sp.]
MKILGISFGRKNGNNDSMCRTVLKECKELGAETEFINMLNVELKPCTGCLACTLACFSGQGNVCSIKDDDCQWLQDKIVNADGIIISAPIFEKCAPSQFHIVLDRFGPRMAWSFNTIMTQMAERGEGKPVDPAILKKKAISFMAIGGSDWGTTVQNDFFSFALTQNMAVIDNEWFDWGQDTFAKPERVERARQIGRNLFEAAKDPHTATWKGDAGVCPHCHSRSFYIHEGKKVVCSQCGMYGSLEEEHGEWVFKYTEEMLKRAHDTESGAWIHADEVGENAAIVKDLLADKTYKARVKELADEFPSVTP